MFRRRSLNLWAPPFEVGSSQNDWEPDSPTNDRLGSSSPSGVSVQFSPPSSPAIVLDRWKQCYLEDAASTCAVCWITSGKDGAVQFGGCPPEISIQWDRAPPKRMHVGEDYEVEYTLKIGADLRKAIVKQDNVHLPHANIHSCFPTAGTCTPFIQNTPGLATHTAELEADLDADGTARFKSVINLPENRYTIIAHIRLFVPSASCPAGASSPDCLDKIDMAIGEQRTITKAPPKASAEAPEFIGGKREDTRQQTPAAVSAPTGPPPRCYLDTISGGREDQDTLCPVCWETPTNDASIKAKIVHCPPGFELDWTKAPPKQLVQGEDYDVSYRVKIGNWLDRLEADRQGFDISHANIHSCFASVKECTPSIVNTPGLATHTNAQRDNVDQRGEADFTSVISQLPPGEYTVIAHVRFFMRKGGAGSARAVESSGQSQGVSRDGLVQYDAAIGLRRTVRSDLPSSTLFGF